jgi:predicted MFS family arabinose efflux permease
VPVIVFCLIIVSTCGLLVQASSTSYAATTPKIGTSAAVGLYVTSYYIGGTFGGWLPGIAFEAGGWPWVVALVLGMLAIMAFTVAKYWD